MESETMRSAFAALSDPTRLKIVLFLATRQADESGSMVRCGSSEEEICGHIAEASCTFMTITHHLFELESAGLISIGRKDNQITCSIRPFMFRGLAVEIAALGQ